MSPPRLRQILAAIGLCLTLAACGKGTPQFKLPKIQLPKLQMPAEEARNYAPQVVLLDEGNVVKRAA